VVLARPGPVLSLVLEHLRWWAQDGCTAPPNVITEEVFPAKFVAECAMPMAKRTYGDAACTPIDRNTATRAHWIANPVVHVREMQRNVRLPGLTTADTIHAACNALIEAGWLGQPVHGTGFQQRGTMSYPVSPRILEVLSR
jgi:hypothetical protein